MNRSTALNFKKMLSNTKISFSKQVVLFAATCFSATVFAATCPLPSEIHFAADTPTKVGLATRYLETDSGWTSTQPVFHTQTPQVGEFKWVDVSPNAAKGAVKDGVVCQYGEPNSRQVKVSMVPSPSTAIKADFNGTIWNTSWSTGCDKKGCHILVKMVCSASIEACEFDSDQVTINPFSIKP